MGEKSSRKEPTVSRDIADLPSCVVSRTSARRGQGPQTWPSGSLRRLAAAAPVVVAAAAASEDAEEAAAVAPVAARAVAAAPVAAAAGDAARGGGGGAAAAAGDGHRGRGAQLAPPISMVRLRQIG